jgi:hypothetical protein
MKTVEKAGEKEISRKLDWTFPDFGKYPSGLPESSVIRPDGELWKSKVNQHLPE